MAQYIPSPREWVCVCLLPQMTLPSAFHSWFFIKQKEIDRSTSRAI